MFTFYFVLVSISITYGHKPLHMHTPELFNGHSVGEPGSAG